MTKYVGSSGVPLLLWLLLSLALAGQASAQACTTTWADLMTTPFTVGGVGFVANTGIIDDFNTDFSAICVVAVQGQGIRLEGPWQGDGSVINRLNPVFHAFSVDPARAITGVDYKVEPSGDATGSVFVTTWDEVPIPSARADWPPDPPEGHFDFVAQTAGPGRPPTIGIYLPFEALNGGVAAFEIRVTLQGEAGPGPRTKLEEFIIEFYQVILLRTPSEAEIAAWRDALTQLGVAGARSAAHGFLMSAEYLDRQVTVFEHVDVLYRALLGREPDGAGRAAWAGEIIRRLNVLLPGFFNSPEFQGLLGSTSLDELVTRFYQHTLGRDPAPGEVAVWVDYLARTGDFFGMAVGFLNSPEYLNTDPTLAEHVTVLYRTFLGREPDAAGLAAWVGLAATQLTPITDGFVASVEFQTTFAALFQ